MIGQKVSNYRVLEKIGAGSFGEVFKAEHGTLGIPVALKFIHPEKMLNSDNRRRFSHEARAAAKLDHTAICKVFDYEEFERGAFIAMDFIQGEDLSKRIEKGPLPLETAVRMAIQVAQGLEEAHINSVIHRDIKPSNLMVTNTGGGETQIKILDFGIARTIDTTRVTETGEIIGTTTYMSPEQIQGKEVDHRTDIWSLGVCLYEMVTGNPPFVGDHPMAAQFAIVQTSPVPVGTLRPETLPELRRIINKALQKKPAKRYQTAQEIRADLEALHQEMCTDLNPVLKWAWKYRNRLVLGISSLLALGLAGIILNNLNPFQNTTPNPFERGRTRLLLHSDACESQPRLSPDGSRVVYTSDAAGNLDVFWVGLGGGNPINLTNHPADDQNPCWLPDGNGILFFSKRSEGAGIWKTDLSGSTPQLILKEGMHPAVSPDGRMIAFTGMDEKGSGRIFVANLDDPTTVTQVSHDDQGHWSHEYPAWAPDGQTIAYGTFHNLWTVSLSNGSARPVTQGGTTDSRPVFSRDGRHLYFSSFRERNSALWRTNLDSGALLKLTPGSGPEIHADLDLAGRKMVYATERSEGDIIISDRKTGRDLRLEGPAEDYMPNLSRDGRQMVFVSSRWNREPDLWMQNLQEGKPIGDPRRLVEQDGTVSQPSISPDGLWVAYYLIRHETKERDIWITPIPAGPPVRITYHPAGEMSPTWSPDGKKIAFVSDREGSQSIFAIPVRHGHAAGPATRITPVGLRCSLPSWSADGKLIAFQAAKDGYAETWVVVADGSEDPHPVTRRADTYAARWVWGLDEIWASGKWGGNRNEIRRLDVDGGPPRPLDPPLLMDPTNGYPLFFPDSSGRFVVHEIEEMKGDIWLLEADEDVRF